MESVNDATQPIIDKVITVKYITCISFSSNVGDLIWLELRPEKSGPIKSLLTVAASHKYVE